MNKLLTIRKNVLTKTFITRRYIGFFLSVVLAALMSGCNKQESTEVQPELNNIAVEPSPPASSMEEMDARLGLRNLIYSDDASHEKITLGEVQFSDESLIVNMEAIVEEGTLYHSALWYQLSGPESVIVTPEKTQTQVVLPSVDIESTLTYRFVIVTDANEVLYQDTSIVVLPSERQITIQPTASNEFSTSQTFNIQFNKAFNSDIELQYSTHPLTADQSDFEPLTNTVTLPAGEVSLNIDVPVINDFISEETEFYYLNLVSSDGTYSARAIGVIVDNDIPVYSGTSYATTEDFSLDATQNALIAINCDNSAFLPSLTNQCSSEASCEPLGETITVTENENEKILSWDQLPDGSYRLSVKNESSLANACTLTVIWGNLSREYKANLTENEWFHMDFSASGDRLETSKPIGIAPRPETETPFEIRLIEATSSSLHLEWPEIPGATLEFYMGSATERALHSITSENSILLESLSAGSNYCFHVVATGLASQDEVSEVFCTQLPVEIAGALEFQLSWTYDVEDNGPDLDLHVNDPDGTNWSYENAIGHTNPNLDIDDTGSGNGGPERMYWEAPPSGTYQYRVDWYGTGGSQLTYADYTLRIYTDKNLVVEKQGRLAVGADSEIFAFDYETNQE